MISVSPPYLEGRVAAIEVRRETGRSGSSLE